MTITRIIVFLPLVFVFATLYVLPHLSRRSQFFSVTAPPGFRETNEARAIMRTYYRQVTAHCAVSLSGIVLVEVRNAQNWLVLAILWPAVGSLVAIGLAHRAALRHAAPSSGVRQASLQPRTRTLPGGPLVWLGPFAILAASAAYVSLHWNQIPSRFPIHWALDGRPNGWSTRSLSGVYQGVLVGALICLVLLAVSSQIASNSRGSAASRKMTMRVMLGACYYLAALFGWTTVSLPLGIGGPTTTLVVALGGFPIILGATLFFGMRAKVEEEPDADSPATPDSVLGLNAPVGDNTADRNWKAGLIYFNPDDPALFVEKRIGIGYDLNFGNPKAWVFMGVILLIPVAIVLMKTA